LFLAFKRAYGKEIRGLAESCIEHIDKKAFLASFIEVFDGSLSEKNIQSSFNATGLVPHNPEAVLLKLEVKPRTPTPSAPGDAPWEALFAIEFDSTRAPRQLLSLKCLAS
jgi:hypothetical protein